jgi:chromosome segregation ATPase
MKKRDHDLPLTEVKAALAALEQVLPRLESLEALEVQLASTEKEVDLASGKLSEINANMDRVTKRHAEAERAHAKACEVWDREIRERQTEVRKLTGQIEQLQEKHGAALQLIDVNAALAEARAQHAGIMASVEALRKRFG